MTQLLAHKKFHPLALWETLQDWLAPAAVLAYQLMAVLAFLVIPILGFRWSQQPFIGAFVEHTRIVNTAVYAPQSTAWELARSGLPSGAQIAAIQGIGLEDSTSLSQALSAFQIGEPIELTLRIQDGSQQAAAVRLQRFPLADQFAYFILPYLIGWIFLGSSLWVFTLRRWDAAGRAYAIFSTAVGLSIACLFDTYTTNVLTPLWTFSVALVGGGLINLALLFPDETPLVTRFPVLNWIGYLPAVLLGAAAMPMIYDFSRPGAYVGMWRLEYAFTSLAALFFLGAMLLRRYRAQSPLVREQARLLAWGFGVSTAPLAAWALISSVFPGTRPLLATFTPYLLPSLAIFPLAAAYAILRYRLLSTDTILSRATVYLLMTILAVTGYALLVSGLGIAAGSLLPANQPLLIGLMVFVLALAFNPLRGWLQTQVDRVFFRGQMIHQERLQSFSHELTETLEISRISNRLYENVQETLAPAAFHLFIHEPQSDQFSATADIRGKLTTDLRFPASSAIVQTLSQRRSPIFLGGTDTVPVALQSERIRLMLLGAVLFAPLPGQQRLVGWMALGPRLSGEPYTSRDLEYLEALSDQAALAVERAQVIANLERRVREMDVLSRVAQGVNITLAFDDMLELIYAQTYVLIPTRDFRVTLRDEHGQGLYHAFYIEDDERLSARERAPLPPGQGLEAVVVEKRRTLLCEDYEQECRTHSALPDAAGIYAWVGVPLNAGAETIGVISLGLRDPTLALTGAQAGLLQAIADQTAGAIVKARLLEETERRARHLAMLNEIGRTLTSTLDLKPLLQQIMHSAAEMLDCEAGSLFMVDEQTGELVFEVTVGPVAADLAGQRLPPGTGVVGKVVASGQPVITNQARSSNAWYADADRQTGFVTRDLLAVPLNVRRPGAASTERAAPAVIGVLEVINKRSGLPFNLEDQELLTAFTGQAAVAIENARLYTQTDQALAARVEEMSVMQRIDRELNASLDLERSMNITLHWSLRQSRAETGLLGLLEEGEAGLRLHIMASQGLPSLGNLSEASSETGGRLYPSLTVGSLLVLGAIQNGNPTLLSPEQALFEEQTNLFAGSQKLLVVPVLRQQNAVGLLLLASSRPDAFPPEVITFLDRLSDHAAIAISNAQLYADLQAANSAKTEFVSLVSHELKTPMTAIRGYTDLLAQGAVGAVNEVQANFLGTIRSNVNRMATLVTDLADVSRIESNRLRLEYSAISLAEAAQETTRTAQAQIDAKSQVLKLDLPADLPAVWADLNRTIQVLNNLVSNANKYSPSGAQITVTARRERNRWDEKGAPQVVHIAVADTGYGISEEDQKKIFQKFFRAEDQNIRESPGTGLGLNITRHLVEMQGGKIWFESELGKGTTFHFTIPVADA